MSLAITGASGYMGRRTARLLLERGTPARDLILISRTPEKLADFAASGAQTRFGDFTDASSLVAAFAGAERMFLINAAPDHLPKGLDRQTVHCDAIAAAKAAGVAHMFFLSMIGSDQPGTPYYRVEPALKASGMRWTMLRTAGYADSLGRDARRLYIPQGRIGSRDDGTRKTAYASRDDYCEAAAAALASDGHDGQAYNITGPQYSLRDVAALLSELSGKTIVVEQLQGEALRQYMLARGTDPEIVEMIMKSPGNAAYLADRTDIASDFPRLIGREAYTLHQHFAAHKAELLGGKPPAGEEPVFT
jgi:NAD(P)H dehydrogenase (quinone)